MDNLFTPSAKNVLLLAQEQAKYFHHHAVGTEHLLMALVMEKDGIAGKTLRQLGVTENDVHDEIERFTGYGLLMPPVKLAMVICHTHQKARKFWHLPGTKQNA